MIRITTILATLFLSLTFLSPAVAQIAPGTPVSGEVEGRFLGKVISYEGNDIYVAEVAMEGNFKSGVPFEGPLMLDIETSESLVIGDPIRGRVRALVTGAIDEYSDEGLKFSAAASTVDYEWQTIQAFGGTSKQGGTNVFRLELADIIFSITGSSDGNDI